MLLIEQKTKKDTMPRLKNYKETADVKTRRIKQVDGKNKAETKPTKSKPIESDEVEISKNIPEILKCEFIGVTLIRTHSESNRPMSTNIRVPHACRGLQAC